MNDSTSNILDESTDTVIITNQMQPAKPIDIKERNDTTPTDIKARTVQSGRIEGYALLRYSPKMPAMNETSTQG